MRTSSGYLRQSAFAFWALIVMLDLAFSVSLRALASPATQPASIVDPAAVVRAKQIRALLLDALEQSYRNGGQWPARLPEAQERRLKLVYRKPKNSVIAPDAGSAVRARSEAAATVVLYEPIAENPGGVWVGYADGHLEFAKTAETLKDCQNQLQFLANQPAEPATQPVD
jgi:hypothetical protein